MGESSLNRLRPSPIGQLELFDAAPVSFLAIDPKGRIADLNREAALFLGATPEGIMGSVFSGFLGEGQRADYQALLDRFFTDAAPFDFDARFPDAQGEERRVKLCGTPLSGTDGRPLLCVTLCKTRGDDPHGDRRRAESERGRLIAELKRKNLELEQFTFSVSHDLKGPLHTIKGFVEIMQHEVEGRRYDNVASDLARVRDAADRMQELLDAILALSRIGRVIGPKDEVPLGPLVEEVLRLLDGQIRRRGVAIQVAPDLPVVRGDRVRLREVVQNLVENAVKFMGVQSDPRVEISAQTSEGEVRVSVVDNGIGLLEKDQRTIFELFRKLDHGIDGAGVGLALVKRIMEVHGGRIWAESGGPGQGSTFVFTLPSAGVDVAS